MYTLVKRPTAGFVFDAEEEEEEEREAVAVMAMREAERERMVAVMRDVSARPRTYFIGEGREGRSRMIRSY